MKKLLVILFLLVGLVLASSSVFAVTLMQIACDSSGIVGVTSEISSNYQLVSVNLSTGLLTGIHTYLEPLQDTSLMGGCAIGGVFYYVRVSGGNCYIVSVNLSTGVLTQSPALHF
jgi:hypothetical protein